MADPFEVKATELGVVRVFSTDLEPQGNAAITPQNLQKLLGKDIDLDPSKVEVFPSKMIEPIGLSVYLSDGYGIPEDDLAGTSAALDALAGLIILVPSSAFKGQATRLEPTPGIRFVGAFREPKAAPPKPMTNTVSTEGVLSPQGSAPAKTEQHRQGWVLALCALLAAAGLVLYAVF